MRNLFLIFVLFAHLCNLYSQDVEYELSPISEEYNTRYFYCANYSEHPLQDKLEYLDVELPQAFVLELSALEDGEQSVIVFNDNNELIISKKDDTYYFNRLSLNAECNKKISLYFVNKKVKIYFDEQKVGELRDSLNPKKRVGIKWDKKGENCYRLLNCFEPIPFKVADYGEALEGGRLDKDNGIRKNVHSVREPYNLTFPTDNTCNSERSIRFEYRFENSKKEGASRMLRGRSEISGVFSRSPMNKWIIEFDFYVPSETHDDSTCAEVITQLHEGSSTPTFPTFVMSIINGTLQCSVKGDSTLISDWKRNKRPSHINKGRQYPIEKNRWYHIKAYVKEGYQTSAMPLTMVWVDGVLAFESHSPNCYNYLPSRNGFYDYLKFGIYKSGWLKADTVDSRKEKRIYLFDNYVVKY